MKILLSNDDGYRAEGLRCLAEYLRDLAELVIVAPERNCSGASNSLTLDTPLRLTDVGDGTYFVKITASDAASNAPTTALIGELESTSFDIDNTPPRIEVQPAARAGNGMTIAFAVRDEQSAVQRVEYSLDASRYGFAARVVGESAPSLEGGWQRLGHCQLVREAGKATDD